MRRDRPKAVICVGFGKSGTTLVDQMLRHSTREFLTPRGRKELNFFRHPKSNPDLASYLAHFDVSSDGRNPWPDDRALFEASPAYATTRDVSAFSGVIANIRKVFDAPKILFCLRHPVYRAFSHYVHDLQTFSLLGYRYVLMEPSQRFARIFDLSFAQSLGSHPVIHVTYYEAVRAAVNAFGSQNVMLFVLESDAPMFDRFYRRLCAFVDVPYRPYFERAPVARVFEGRRLPDYFYAHEGDLPIRLGARQYLLPEGDLLVANDEFGTQVLHDVDPDTALALLSSSRRWTPSLTAAEAREVYQERFAAEMNRLGVLMESSHPGVYDLGIYDSYLYVDKRVGRSQPDERAVGRMLKAATGTATPPRSDRVPAGSSPHEQSVARDR